MLEQNFDTGKVYVKTDEGNRIIAIDGGYTPPENLDGWTQIDEGRGDKYNLCQNNYLPGSLYTHNGIPRYKLQDGKAVERSAEEIESDKVSTESHIQTPEQSAVLMMRAVFAQQAADMDDDTIIRYSGLADEWKPGDYKTGDIYNADEQTWECYQPYNNDVYPDIKPGNPAWFTFNRPLHGKSPETARPFVPVQGAHDMYHAGEYAVYTDGKTYCCKSDTAYSPSDFPEAWEVYNG